MTKFYPKIIAGSTVFRSLNEKIANLLNIVFCESSDLLEKNLPLFNCSSMIIHLQFIQCSIKLPLVKDKLACVNVQFTYLFILLLFVICTNIDSIRLVNAAQES